jgi:hypothetical protein
MLLSTSVVISKWSTALSAARASAMINLGTTFSKVGMHIDLHN